MVNQSFMDREIKSHCDCVPILEAVEGGHRITLRGATACVLRGTGASPLSVMLSLASGELYIARLRCDGRGVRGCTLSRVVPTVPAICACALTPAALGGSNAAANGGLGTYLFLGSAVADSLLLQITDPLAPAPKLTLATVAATPLAPSDA